MDWAEKGNQTLLDLPCRATPAQPFPQSITILTGAVEMENVSPLDPESSSNHLHTEGTLRAQLCSLRILPNSLEQPQSWHREFPGGLTLFKGQLAVQTHHLLLPLFELSSNHWCSNWIPLPLLACAAWVIYVNIKLK